MRVVAAQCLTMVAGWLASWCNNWCCFPSLEATQSPSHLVNDIFSFSSHTLTRSLSNGDCRRLSDGVKGQWVSRKCLSIVTSSTHSHSLSKRGVKIVLLTLSIHKSNVDRVQYRFKFSAHSVP